MSSNVFLSFFRSFDRSVLFLLSFSTSTFFSKKKDRSDWSKENIDETRRDRDREREKNERELRKRRGKKRKSRGKRDEDELFFLSVKRINFDAHKLSTSFAHTAAVVSFT